MTIGLHARVAARMYQSAVDALKAVLPTPPGHWRFPTLRALAALLLSYDANITPEDAAHRIDTCIREMTERHAVMLGKSMDSGLSSSAAESGATMFGFEHLFSDDFCSDPAFLNCEALGEKPIREFLKTIADTAGSTPSRLVAETYGQEFTGTERQLVIALNRSLMIPLQHDGDFTHLPGERGVLGWKIQRCKDRGPRAYFKVVNIGAQHVAHPAVTGMEEPNNPFFKDPDARNTGGDSGQDPAVP